MATPTPMWHALSQSNKTSSQQGKTPSQSHGAVATPAASTPFSMPAYTALTPQGYRFSPQQVRKSPAHAAIKGAHMPLNFDSPSTAAALGSMTVDLDLSSLTGLGTLAKNSEDQMAKRLEEVMKILGRRKGILSEAGIERLAKKLGLEYIWENTLDSSKKTFVMAGSALELLIAFDENVVQSVSLAFPDSAPLVSRHAVDAAKILENDLKLGPDESALVKAMDRFAVNFERLASLDKFSVMPGLNLFEAIAGIYESLNRLHAREMVQLRNDSSLTGKSDEHLQDLVLCTKSGNPVMNQRDRVGLCLEYWRDRRLGRSAEEAFAKAIVERPCGLLIGCSPLSETILSPVRVSDQWIGADVMLPTDVHDGLVPDWREPENTVLSLGDKLGTDSLLGPRMPEVGFVATLDPPVHLPSIVFQHMTGFPAVSDASYDRFDCLLFPSAVGLMLDQAGSVSITSTRSVSSRPVGEPGTPLSRHYTNTLTIHRPITGNTLKQVAFAHPRQLVQSLPYLRQYVFFARLLDRSFRGGTPGPLLPGRKTVETASRHELLRFLAQDRGRDQGQGQGQGQGQHQGQDQRIRDETAVRMDITLLCHPTPRMQVIFPFGHSTAAITIEIRENAKVHVLSQNVIGPNSSRRPEDLGRMLEMTNDLNQWCEYIRTRGSAWA